MSIRLIALLVGAAIIAAGVGAWWVRQTGRTLPVPERVLRSWKGGELSACTVTVNGATLTEFVRDYNVVMLCGVGRGDRNRLTDRAITVSSPTAIAAHDFEIEEAVSGPMRVLLEGLARRAREALPGADRLQEEALWYLEHEEALWYELVLLPKSVEDPFAVTTVADVERLGGRRLSTEPLWTVITVRP